MVCQGKHRISALMKLLGSMPLTAVVDAPVNGHDEGIVAEGAAQALAIASRMENRIWMERGVHDASVQERTFVLSPSRALVVLLEQEFFLKNSDSHLSFISRQP
jgi:hypothetical protein